MRRSADFEKKNSFSAFSGGSSLTRLQRTKRRRDRPNTRKPPKNLTSGIEIPDFGWRAAAGKPLAAARPSGLIYWAQLRAKALRRRAPLGLRALPLHAPLPPPTRSCN